MSALQLAIVLAPTALQLLWLRRVGAIRGRARQAAHVLVYGAASAVAAGAIEALAQPLLGLALPEGTVAWHAARCMLCIALVEELCKLLAARRGVGRRGMGTLPCCVLAAMGFDLAENLVYSTTATLAVSVVRALTSIARHVLCGAIMGTMLERAESARSPGGEATAWRMASVAAPTAVHGLYDLCLYTLPPSIAAVFALSYGVAGTVAAVVLARGELGRHASRR